MKLTKITPEVHTLLPLSGWTGTIRAYRTADRVILHLEDVAPTEALSAGHTRQLMALPEDLQLSGRVYATISKRSSMASRIHVRVHSSMVHVLPINTGLTVGDLIGDRIEYSLLR